MPFKQLGLIAELTDAVSQKGYSSPSPIQAKAIPAILDGRDVIGGAQTGTGKTAAFSLPLLQLLDEADFYSKRPRALILAPTRELAAQVHQSILDYGRDLDLRSTVIFGGVGFQKQISALRRGVEIVVATPGRLLDLCQQGEAQLSNIEYLILDEADRMLDMGFIHDIKKILRLLPAKRQNLFFSATYSQEVKRLADTILHNPVEVEVTPRNSTAERVDQEAYQVGQKSKRDALSQMIDLGDWSQTLVFTRTKHGANRLATQLEKDGISAMAIHGNKSQSARERALKSFKDNRIRVLVATDIAARGLDIASLPYVVNYELPNIAEDYVHRIGRTGRAGKAGKAISLVCEAEHEYLWEIERLLKKEIPLYTLNAEGERTAVDRELTPLVKPPKKKAKSGGQRGGFGGGGGRGGRGGPRQNNNGRQGRRSDNRQGGGSGRRSGGPNGQQSRGPAKKSAKPADGGGSGGGARTSAAPKAAAPPRRRNR